MMFEMSCSTETVRKRKRESAEIHWQCLIKAINVKESFESKVGKIMSVKAQSSLHI